MSLERLLVVLHRSYERRGGVVRCFVIVRHNTDSVETIRIPTLRL